ncbi:DUF7302 family protein [Cellulomonas shaoxiangyii]|uniref:DUF7302 family protein n=1 Tax=Cellulomonas shaoxiangyii TaxID=2566013 RepID=UPI00140E7AA4|nr:hypothetical protein [Cellulomonas shaoxiangyii]
MVRLIAPNGATVDVSEEKAERLAAQGFRASDGDGAKPARRTRKATAKAASDDE